MQIKLPLLFTGLDLFPKTFNTYRLLPVKIRPSLLIESPMKAATKSVRTAVSPRANHTLDTQYLLVWMQKNDLYFNKVVFNSVPSKKSFKF